MAHFKKIFQKRINEEKDLLKTLDKNIYTYKFPEDKNDRIDVVVNPGKPYEQYSFIIVYGSLFPFREPEVLLKPSPGLYSLADLSGLKKPELFLKRAWTADQTWKELILAVHEYQKKHMQPHDFVQENLPLKLVHSKAFRSSTRAILLVLFFAVAIRVLCGLGGYSGINDPPTYGDYEAQRHWMEMTVNVPAVAWYAPGPWNNLTYWRLDYPPGSGYLSLAFGIVSRYIEPESMRPIKSYGYETPSHKMFMRWTVLLCDVLILMTAIVSFVLQVYKKYNSHIRTLFLLLILSCPLLTLIDHGHFQYNCVMLGLTLWAFLLCIGEDIWIGSVLFVLALNVKQMALYYSLPFFCFIVGYLWKTSETYTKQQTDKKPKTWIRYVVLLAQCAQVGIFVALTMLVIWLPWIHSKQSFLDVLSAIFPVKRGLYQLKVATFWCISDILIKWQTLFPTDVLLKLSIFLTLGTSLPSITTLLRLPRAKYFLVALFNVSMAFFFFSYHVHEKTILIPLLPFILNIRYFKTFYVDFILVATFTNYHMLVEDRLQVQCLVAMLAFGVFGRVVMGHFRKAWTKEKVETKPEDKKKQDKLKGIIDLIEVNYAKYVSKLLPIVMMVLLLADGSMTPPAKYPFLFHLLFALVGFGVFAIVFLYSNLKMIYSFRKDYALEKKVMEFDIKKVLGKVD